MAKQTENNVGINLRLSNLKEPLSNSKHKSRIKFDNKRVPFPLQEMALTYYM